MWAELPICNRYTAACCVAPGHLLQFCKLRVFFTIVIIVLTTFVDVCRPSHASVSLVQANTHACGCPRHHPTALQLGRNAVRSCLTGGVVLLEYCLVLVVVTFNLGLILSATLGFCLGALIFGKLPTGVS